MNIFQLVEQGATRAGLSFVVIGGLAVIEHGYSRLTADFDLLVPGKDKDRWHTLLIELGYRLKHEQDTFRQYEAGENIGLPVDLMFVKGPTFDGILAAAQTATVQGATLRLASLEHLLALKLHALKQSRLQRFLKDFDDVIHLVQLNHMDLQSPRIRDLFIKYGNADLYGKICRACEQE